jgi:hypothetical protein
MPILLILCYNGSLVTWTVVSLTAVKLKPFIFYLSGLALPCAANVFFLMILYDLCLLSAQFYYTITYTEGWKPCANRATGVRLGIFPMVLRTLFCRRCNFKKCLLHTPRRGKNACILTYTYIQTYEAYTQNKLRLQILPLQRSDHYGAHAYRVCWSFWKTRTQFADNRRMCTNRPVCLKCSRNSRSPPHVKWGM